MSRECDVHWLLHFLGLDSASGPAYLAWSGAASDISELVLLGGVCAFLRKHNCAVHHCWRLGRHTTAGGHIVCHHHSPMGAPTHQDVINAHLAAKRRPERNHGG